jgi:hypothetical protein
MFLVTRQTLSFCAAEKLVNFFLSSFLDMRAQRRKLIAFDSTAISEARQGLEMCIFCIDRVKREKKNRDWKSERERPCVLHACVLKDTFKLEAVRVEFFSFFTCRLWAEFCDRMRPACCVALHQ